MVVGNIMGNSLEIGKNIGNSSYGNTMEVRNTIDFLEIQ